MAVTVKKHFAGKLRRLIAGGMMLEKFAEKKRLTAQPPGAWVRWKQIAQLIAKNGGAAWFQDHHRYVSVNLFTQRMQDPLQILLSLVEHAEIIERATTAEMLPGNDRIAARRNEHLQRGAARFRVKIIIEGVRPQNNLAPLALDRR